MGLSYKEWKFRSQALNFLASFGITEEDIKYLPEALKIVKELKQPQAHVLTKEEEKKIAEDFAMKKTPAELVQAFAGEEEEFYPNGRNNKL